MATIRLGVATIRLVIMSSAGWVAPFKHEKLFGSYWRNIYGHPQQLQITTVAVRADMIMYSCTAFRNGNYFPDSKTEWETYLY